MRIPDKPDNDKDSFFVDPDFSMKARCKSEERDIIALKILKAILQGQVKIYDSEALVNTAFSITDEYLKQRETKYEY